MKMGLYKIFSSNVEIQYKSYFLSKAMLFTMFTTLLTLILPFILAYRSRGFWLKSHEFYEQPTVHFTYEYLLVAETEDPVRPIVCGEAAILEEQIINEEEHCAEVQVQEYDYTGNGKNDILDFKFKLSIPTERSITSISLLLALDFKLQTVCPLHMQGLAVINRELALPPSGLKYFGDLQFYQVAHLPCVRHTIDTKYNSSLFNHVREGNENIVDFIYGNYFSREAIVKTETLYSRSQSGKTGAMNIDVRLRVPEVKINYIPSILQELKWAWPQYLSLALIFHCIFYKIKKFVFSNRLVMAWEIMPWKKY